MTKRWEVLNKLNSKASPTKILKITEPDPVNFKLWDSSDECSKLFYLVRGLYPKNGSAPDEPLSLQKIENLMRKSFNFYCNLYGSDPKEFHNKISQTEAYKMVFF